ncbi:MAG TPA: hypothetical protein DCE47_03115 [Planctomycetaceae bacterium]|nr:hypothetical protein [Planctomycetaceae bacterium]
MAKSAAMLPPDLSEIAESLHQDDEVLTADELQQISLFDGLKKTPSFDRFPGFTVLRRCEPGRVICEQGDAGATAFAILTSQDVLAIRRQQLQTLQSMAAGEPVDHLGFESLDDQERAELVVEYEAEIAGYEDRCGQLESAAAPARRQLEQVAAAQLVVSLEPTLRSRGIRGWLNSLFSGRRKRAGSDGSQLIPVDGPSDIDSETRQAPLFEGELFGEMSCMNRSPRSATVVATGQCYLLEMVRNVLDTLHNDPKYKLRMDAVYRERVLEGHIRQLSLFKELDEVEFSKLREHVELVEFESGGVICEEFAQSDCIYVIRSGVVKVLANAWTSLRTAEFEAGDWTVTYADLASACREDAELVAGLVAAVFDEPLQGELIARAGSGEVSAEINQQILDALNTFILGDGIPKELGKTAEEVAALFGDADFHDLLAGYSGNCQNWSQLETRTCRRWLLELAFPAGIPRRDESVGTRRTLAYLGRGDPLGEMGVVLDEPRNATCVAYDHPDSGFHQRIPDSRTGAVPSRVELVRIPRNILHEMMASSDSLKSVIDDIVRRRQRDRQEQAKRTAVDPASLRQQTPRFEQLGLVQGQQLMLIDLDRCTRCGSCVDACIAAHDDGNTRLYLDGPRYENYLVPLTCRQCLDPVCMIGCPVGAINRGDSGEIQIRNWCIGCRLCAEQCPYGSIQMNHLPVPVEPDEHQWSLLGEDAEVKKVTNRAVVCDMCSSLSSGEPSCVYSCPHEAAIRVNARGFFFESEEIAGVSGDGELAS